MLQGDDQEARWLPASGDTKSVISGEPGILFRTSEVSTSMTVGELRRLVFRSLRPEEFKALKEKHGIFFEIHDDFYDPETGEALQPKD
jgi:hypothetical protein